MEKYVIEPGVVESLAADLEAVQSAHAANVGKRLRMLTEQPGILMNTEDAYELTWQLVGNIVELRCRETTAVVWPDYQMSKAADDVIKAKYILVPLTEYDGYIMLTKSVVYEEPGTYSPGYPTDPGVELLNTRSSVTQTLTLDTERTYNNDNLPLYQIHIGADGQVKVIADLRPEYCFVLKQDIAVLPPPEPIALSVRSRSLLSMSGATDTAELMNRASPLSNAAANQIALDVMWYPATSEEEVWAYDVRCIPLEPNGALSETIAMRELTLARSDGQQYKISFPAIHGVAYRIMARSLSNRSNRLPGAWVEVDMPLAGADQILARPSAPVVEIQKLVEDPLTINLRVEVDTALPRPYKVQIFKRNSTIYSIGFQEQVLVYEGMDGDIQVMAEALEYPQFRARVVVGGMICSDYSAWQSVPDGVPPVSGSDITRMTISIPIAVKINASQAVDISGQVFCGSFYMPRPSAKITALDFVSNGSYEYRIYAAGAGEPAQIGAEGLCFEIAPHTSPTEDTTARLYCAVDGNIHVDIHGWFDNGHGVMLNGEPASSYPKYHRCWYINASESTYVNNQLPEDAFTPDQLLDVALAYDVKEGTGGYGGSAGSIVIITGTLNITLEPIL